MLYYLFTYLREHFGLFGAGVFYYITFRAAMAIIVSLIITMVFGKGLIRYLHKKQIGETVRDLPIPSLNCTGSGNLAINENDFVNKGPFIA